MRQAFTSRFLARHCLSAVIIGATIAMMFPLNCLAEAGSTGGTVGNTDKSISGGAAIEPEPQEKHTTPTKQTRPEARKVENRQTRPPARRSDGARGGYVGCFRDQGNAFGKEGRDLNGARWDDGSMTNSRCVSFCAGQGFAYAATQYSTACFCGNSYGRSGSASNCDMACGGNKSQKCGGSWANSVWRTGAARR